MLQVSEILICLKVHHFFFLFCNPEGALAVARSSGSGQWQSPACDLPANPKSEK